MSLSTAKSFDLVGQLLEQRHPGAADKNRNDAHLTR
jgi:hypothetical protein